MIGAVLSALAGGGEAALAALPRLPPEVSQARVLNETANRPWPIPEEPWLMAQTWRDLLFAHWALPPEAVRRVLPPSLPLDTFDGQAWIGITPFELRGLRPRGGLPVPRMSRFPELNVRTYTTLDGKPGIYFLSLDAASSVAVLAARRSYRLPYFSAAVAIERRSNGIRYTSTRTSSDGAPAAFDATYHATSPINHAEPGSLDYFVTERYCLYTTDETGAPWRAEIQHPPWPLQAAEASISRNSMTVPWGISLPDEGPVLHYSALQNVLIWPLRPAS